MRRTTFILGCFFALLLSSCTTNEDRALALADAYMQTTLYDYGSYQPQGVSVDTLHYAPQLSTIFSKFEPLIEILEQQNEAKEAMKFARRKMAIYDRRGSYYYSSFDQLQYEEASEEYNEANAKLNRCESAIETIKTEVQSLVEEIESGSLEDQPGWCITHMYTCKTRGGQDTGGAILLFADNNFEEILFAIDEDDMMEMSTSLEALGLDFPTF